MIRKKVRKGLVMHTALFMLFNATSSFADTNTHDPYERYNRVTFKFNDFLDHYVLKPVAFLYDKIVPKPLAKGFTNFYANVDNVPAIINDVLQGNLYQASSDAWRLLINTTLGIGGLFDVASRIGLEPNSEDFGLTLAQWGYKNSNYVVLPFFGPSTFRDAISMPVNYYGMTVYPYVHPTSAQYSWYAGGVVVRRADLLHYESFMQQIALDKYVFVRDAYLQHRNYLIERNKQLGNPYLQKNKLESQAAVAEEVKSTIETKPFVDI